MGIGAILGIAGKGAAAKAGTFSAAKVGATSYAKTAATAKGPSLLQKAKGVFQKVSEHTGSSGGSSQGYTGDSLPNPLFNPNTFGSMDKGFYGHYDPTVYNNLVKIKGNGCSNKSKLKLDTWK